MKLAKTFQRLRNLADKILWIFYEYFAARRSHFLHNPSHLRLMLTDNLNDQLYPHRSDSEFLSNFFNQLPTFLGITLGLSACSRIRGLKLWLW